MTQSVRSECASASLSVGCDGIVANEKTAHVAGELLARLKALYYHFIDDWFLHLGKHWPPFCYQWCFGRFSGSAHADTYPSPAELIVLALETKNQESRLAVCYGKHVWSKILLQYVCT